MNNRFVVVVLLLVSFTCGSFAQKKPIIQRFTISNYLRNMGLLYVETLEEMEKACGVDLLSDDFTRCVDQHKEMVKMIDDRIGITIKTEADRRFRFMLQMQYLNTSMYVHQRALGMHKFAECLATHREESNSSEKCSDPPLPEAVSEWAYCGTRIRGIIQEGLFTDDLVWDKYCKYGEAFRKGPKITGDIGEIH